MAFIQEVFHSLRPVVRNLLGMPYLLRFFPVCSFLQGLSFLSAVVLVLRFRSTAFLANPENVDGA
jgi:hypothetical protein